jgi:hypothetical protein
MNSHLSTRSLLIALATLILAVCAYFLFSVSSRGGVAWRNESAPPMTVEEKAEVLHSLTQTSEQNTAVTPSEAVERLRTLENVAQSSGDSPAAQQSDAEKAKILESLQTQ